MNQKPKHPAIPLSPAKSSQIAAVGHQGDTLAVQFKSGGAIYHYKGVTAETFAAMQKAESIGKHFGAHIRSKFEHVRIDK